MSEQAQLVANNMTVVRRSTTELVEADPLTVDHIVELHRSLLPDQPHHHGLRTAQNWIGGSDGNPIEADFVPPAPERVPELMTDLVAYMNGAAHSSLMTIHPFTDGNGRVGRALIHTVLARRGLTEDATLPISLVLATLRDRYVDGLGLYRHDSPTGSAGACASINNWLEFFIEACAVAVEQSVALMERIEELRSSWGSRLSAHRTSLGLRAAPRADSAVPRLLERLPEAPVVTATTVSRIFEFSFPAANAALGELRGAEIVQTKKIEQGASAYLAGRCSTSPPRRNAHWRVRSSIRGPAQRTGPFRHVRKADPSAPFSWAADTRPPTLAGETASTGGNQGAHGGVVPYGKPLFRGESRVPCSDHPHAGRRFGRRWTGPWADTQRAVRGGLVGPGQQ